MASVIVGIAKPPLNSPGHPVPSQKSVVNRQHVSLNLGAATARSGCNGVLRRGHFRRQLAPNLDKNCWPVTPYFQKNCNCKLYWEGTGLLLTGKAVAKDRLVPGRWLGHDRNWMGAGSHRGPRP